MLTKPLLLIGLACVTIFRLPSQAKAISEETGPNQGKEKKAKHLAEGRTVVLNLVHIKTTYNKRIFPCDNPEKEAGHFASQSNIFPPCA